MPKITKKKRVPRPCPIGELFHNFIVSELTKEDKNNENQPLGLDNEILYRNNILGFTSKIPSGRKSSDSGLSMTSNTTPESGSEYSRDSLSPETTIKITPSPARRSVIVENVNYVVDIV